MKTLTAQANVLKKYLDLYAEVEVGELDSFPPNNYQNLLFIPVYRESTNFLQYLRCKGPEIELGKYLLILVSNHPTDLTKDEQENAMAKHQKIYQWLDKPVWRSEHLSLHEGTKFDTILVNRTDTNSIPTAQGVGLARKIGADIAAALYFKGAVVTPWAMSTDADAYPPPNYFDIDPDNKCSALTYKYQHKITDNPIGRATELYEASLHHYVNGLKHAGSPYAFETIGSAQAINLFSYAAVRGYPKRSGGEDFYLLNKLAKVGTIAEHKSAVIEIDSRLSNRAPFGTGPAVKRLVDTVDIYAEPIFYNPEIFEHLKLVLGCFNSTDLISLQKEMQQLPAESQLSLSSLGIASALEHAKRQCLDTKRLGKHMHDWFDGFKTLKFVHFMRDLAFPNLSQNELLVFNNER